MNNKLTKKLGYEPEDNCSFYEFVDTLWFAIKDECSRLPFIYIYAKADQMVNHRFTDDVAICFACSKRQALKKFKRLYGEAELTDISRGIHYRGISILTDY